MRYSPGSHRTNTFPAAPRETNTNFSFERNLIFLRRKRKSPPNAFKNAEKDYICKSNKERIHEKRTHSSVGALLVHGGASGRQSIMDALLRHLTRWTNHRLLLPRRYLYGAHLRRAGPSVDNPPGARHTPGLVARRAKTGLRLQPGR